MESPFVLPLRIEELEPLQSYRFHFGEVEEDVSLLSFERDSVIGGLRDLYDGVWTVAERPSFAGVANLLLPRKLKDHLLSGETEVTLDTRESNIPWEILFRNISPGSNLRVRREAPKIKRSNEKGQSGLTVFVTEPDLMPWAVSEAETCRRESSLALIEPSESDSMLIDSQAGCLYLVAFADQQGSLSLGTQRSPEEIFDSASRRSKRVCRLCFIRLVQLSPGRDPSPIAASQRAALTFLSNGTETVIVSAWEPNRDRYSHSLEVFWRTLKDSTVGDAYQALRQAFPVADPRLSSEAFLFFGNSDLRISDLHPVKVPSSLAVTTAPRLGKPDYRLLLTVGPEKGRQIPLFFKALADGRPLTIGRPGVKRCDLEIDDPGMENRVAQLEFGDHQLYLCNLTGVPASVRLNGLPVRDRIRVEGWETIEFGTTAIEILTGVGEKIEKPEPATDKRPFGLRVVAGCEEDLNGFHKLCESFTMIGRQGAFPLSDPSVSRQHCAIIQREGRHFASPLGDSPLAINGVGVSEETELSFNDRLSLSDDTVLEYIQCQDGRS